MESSNTYESTETANLDAPRFIASRSIRRTSSAGSSWRRHSLSFRHQGSSEFYADDDTEDEVVSQAGDIGDRELNIYKRSESGGLRSSIDSLRSIEILPVPEESQWQSPVSPLPAETISPLSTDAILNLKNENPGPPSTQPYKDTVKRLPMSFEYLSCLIHLAVFGILGVITRYLLQKLFGPSVSHVTSDHSALYLDLPSNVVGSFLMGWLGVVFKGDICSVSDLLAIALTTGYLGSLTTFSGWNQKMLDLSVEGQWVTAAVGIFLGMAIAHWSIWLGVETAEGLKWYLERRSSGSESGSSTSKKKFRVDSMKRHLAVIIVLVLMLVLLWGFSGALLKYRLDDEDTSASLWLACIVGPPGVWVRWFLARLNGKGLGKKGSFKWIPFGTLAANVLAAALMAALSTVKKAVDTKKCDIIITGIQLGTLGCLSTVSTFIAEFHAMCSSKHPLRAFTYAAITIIPSFILGTLIYSVPVWVKGY
ncbi:hypothetical protein Sjap_000246 [Stephania japonica]|uniref:Uncharacterized protein n=1 Tax=Stephania japonica TaxID=461633 RepID=A0AAP0KHP4_9MAGN